MTTSKKINKFPHVKLIWEDIQQSNEAWIDEENILENDIAICEDTGYIFQKSKTKLWLFTSYSYDDDGKLSVGGLTVFPLGVIKKIERIK